MHISTSTRAHSSMSDCPRLFSGDIWTTVEKVWSQFMGYCRVHSQVCMPLTRCMGEWDSSRGPWHRCWIPQLPQKYCPWMYARLLWSGRYKWAMCFSAILLIRCFIGSSEKIFLKLVKHYSYSFNFHLFIHSTFICQFTLIHLFFHLANIY